MSEVHKTEEQAAPQRIGVLIVNLGTPDGLGYWSLRRYLSEFLSDRRVIEVNPILWQLILQGPILALRPSRSGRAYAKIWNRELNESPLRTVTREQAEQLDARIGTDELLIDWAMRYGKPSMDERLRSLVERGATRVLVVGLYPQYSAPTTATVYDKAFESLSKMRAQPALRTSPAFHDDPVWIDAIATSIRDHFDGLDWEPEVLLVSFHGTPKEYQTKGDPYYGQCVESARLIRAALGWSEERAPLTFQSRFGPAEWLQPYTDKTLEELAARGVKRVAVVTPGFFADCLETLEEIDIGLREEFLEAGGEQFTAVPCLNTSAAAIDVLETVIRRELGGWIEI